METKVVMVDVIEVESGASIAMPWDVMLAAECHHYNKNTIRQHWSDNARWKKRCLELRHNPFFSSSKNYCPKCDKEANTKANLTQV